MMFGSVFVLDEVDQVDLVVVPSVVDFQPHFPALEMWIYDVCDDLSWLSLPFRGVFSLLEFLRHRMKREIAFSSSWRIFSSSFVVGMEIPTKMMNSKKRAMETSVVSSSLC